MGRVRGGRERGSVFRRRRVRGVVLLSLVLVFTSVMVCGETGHRKLPLPQSVCRKIGHCPHRFVTQDLDKPARRLIHRRNAIKRERPRNARNKTNQSS